MTEGEALVKRWWDGLSTAAKMLLKGTARPIAYHRLEDEEKRGLRTYFDKYVEKAAKAGSS